MQKFYCILWFLIILQLTFSGIPDRYKVAFPPETTCTVENIVYKDGDSIPMDDPCQLCKCKASGISCIIAECEVKPGCAAKRREGECCPRYDNCPSEAPHIPTTIYVPRNTGLQSVTTTPMPTITTQLDKESSTTPPITNTTNPVIIASPFSYESTTSTPFDSTRGTSHPTTPSSMNTTQSLTTPSSIAMDFVTSSSIIKEKTTTHFDIITTIAPLTTTPSLSKTTSIPTITSSAITKTHTGIILYSKPDFTYPPTTESARSSSNEYSTIGITEESSETNPIIEWSKLKLLARLLRRNKN